MGRSAYELQRMGCGFLLEKSMLDRKRIEKMYQDGEKIYITTDPRMIAALKLIGCEVIEKTKIKAIEVFMIA